MLTVTPFRIEDSSLPKEREREFEKEEKGEKEGKDNILEIKGDKAEDKEKSVDKQVEEKKTEEQSEVTEAVVEETHILDTLKKCVDRTPARIFKDLPIAYSFAGPELTQVNGSPVLFKACTGCKETEGHSS